MKNNNLKQNAFQLATIKISVDNIAKTIFFMEHILGFKYIRAEVDEYGMQAFLQSNTLDTEKSIQFCIRQSFYSSNDELLIFGLRPTNETYSNCLRLLHEADFNIEGFETLSNQGKIVFRDELSKFTDPELKNFVVENVSRKEAMYSHLTELAYHYPFVESFDEDCAFSDDEYLPFCDSYLKEIQIKVGNVESYRSVFKRLGFSVSKINYNLSGMRNVEVLMNKHCNISIRFVETSDKLKDFDIKRLVSFVITSTTYREGEGATFIDLNDIGYDFSNKVFDKNHNVIANHAELVDKNEINWTILEMNVA